MSTSSLLSWRLQPGEGNRQEMRQIENIIRLRESTAFHQSLLKQSCITNHSKSPGAYFSFTIWWEAVVLLVSAGLGLRLRPQSPTLLRSAAPCRAFFSWWIAGVQEGRPGLLNNLKLLLRSHLLKSVNQNKSHGQAPSQRGGEDSGRGEQILAKQWWRLSQALRRK